MPKLDSIFIKYDFQKRTSNHSLIFEEIEAKIGFEFPLDYKYFCENYQDFEGEIGSTYISLWDINELLNINLEYSLQEYLPNTIAIGSNMSSEYIAIEFFENSHRIILSPFIDLNKENHIEIGHSFTDFIQKMDNGLEWFS